MALRAGLCAVDEQGQSGLGGQLQPPVGQREVADLVVVDLLGARSVAAHIMCSPPGAERVAARGQLADQVMQLLVPGIPTGFGAQDRHGDVRGRLPVGVERLGPCVEEAVARQVPCPEPSNTSSWKARPRALVARTSLLPLRTNAGPRTTASSARVGPSLGTHVFALRLRTGRAAPSAARARSKRCSRSASSSCSSRATDSRTASETPASLGARGPVQARPQPRHHRLADRPREEGPAAVPPCLRPPERRARRGAAGGSAALGVLLRPAQ